MRNPRFQFAIVLLSAALSMGHLHAATPANIIEISDVAWTESVDRTTFLPGAAITSPTTTEHLILWMQVKGSEAAMKQLLTDGKLPLRHKWFRQTLVNTKVEGVTAMIDSIDVALRASDLVPKLQQELQKKGTFDWRTWSEKNNVSPGRWRVRVAYANGDAVLCSGEPCEYIIDVTK